MELLFDETEIKNIGETKFIAKSSKIKKKVVKKENS